MAVITKQELEDAAVDAQTIEDVANGSETFGGTGVVTSRLGQPVKTLAKVISDLAGQDVGASAAAEINKRLNKYFVTFWGPNEYPVIDADNNEVKYGRMAISRNGESYSQATPSEYSLATFDLPFSPVNSGTAYFHYIDVSLIGTETPVKSVSGATVPTLTEDIVPLGVSLDGAYQCFWSSVVEDMRLPTPVRAIAMQGYIVIDRNDRLGGGTAVYVPRQLYVNSPEQGVTRNGTFGTASAELTSHAKFALTGAVPGGTHTVYFDIDTQEYVLAVNPTQPAGSARRFVPIVTVWDTGHTAYNGLQVYDAQDYDVLRMRQRLWERAANTRHPIIYDRANYYGGGANAVYVYPSLYIQEGSTVVNRNGEAISAERSTELRGYIKLTGLIDSNVCALVFDAETNEISLRIYSNGSIDLSTENLNNIYVLATWWGLDNYQAHAGQIDDTLAGYGANMTAYGKDFIDEMPRKFGSTAPVDVTAPELIALGFTRGLADTTAANQPFAGDNYGNNWIEGGGYAVIRFYLETDTANNFGDPALFFWNSAGEHTNATGETLVTQLSEYVGLIEWRGKIPSEYRDFFYVGSNTQGTEVHVIITGIQYTLSRNEVKRIVPDDFPTPAAAITESDYAARDAANIGLSQAYADRVIAHVQKPTADYNGKFVTGQSLARGHQTQFALSETALYGNKMLGGNVLPTANDGNTYPTFAPGDSWVDMVAIPQDNGAVYTNETSPDGAFAEPWNLAWLNSGKLLFNQMRLVANDPRAFCTWNTAVSGKTIEQLSKVNTQDGTDRFSRLTDAIDRAALASGASTFVISSVMFGQGEWDYSAAQGSVNRTRALYKAALSTYFDDIAAEVFARVPDQDKTPAFFTYLTGAAYTVDTDANGDPDLFVAMAQLELALERKDVWAVSPIYPYPDKGGHLTANGSRWYGEMLAKVEHRVQHLGQDWSPVRPTRIELNGAAIFIDFHVPEPPLVWDAGYVVRSATMYGDKGFRVIDLDNGNATVDITVSLVGKTIVRIDLNGSYSTNLAVYYADKTAHNGNGNLRDSDPAVANSNYVYDAAYMPTGDNIAELVDKPYPLHNWCVPFYYPVGFGV